MPEQIPSSSPSPKLEQPDEPLSGGDLALSQLKDRDLASSAIKAIAQNSELMKLRKVRLAVAAHPRTPRRIALKLIRELYTFDLMQFALMPFAPADLRRVAEELLVGRLPSITLGERISLARRSSETVAAALLADREARVWQTALQNSRLTETGVLKALRRTAATAAFIEAVCHHPKWSGRAEIRVALLRCSHTPLARAIEFAREILVQDLCDILDASRLPERTKVYLRKDMETRSGEISPKH
jgi:hypothetical protein